MLIVTFGENGVDCSLPQTVSALAGLFKLLNSLLGELGAGWLNGF